MSQPLAYENQFTAWVPYHWVTADNKTIDIEAIPEDEHTQAAKLAIIDVTYTLSTLQKGGTL